MSQQPPNRPPEGFQPPQPTQPLPGWGQVPPPRQRPRWCFSPVFWTVTMVGLVGVLVIAVAVAAPWEQTARDAPTATTPNLADEPTPTLINQPTSPPATEPPAPTFATPKARDFTLKVKVLSKDNFGSAGSLITFRIVPNWGPTYDPDKTYEVTYEVRGGEDGPAVNTFTVTGDEYEVEREESASTSSVGQKLTARVVSVEEI